MAFKFNLASMNKLPAGDTSNFSDLTETQYAQGIVKGSDLISNTPNSIMYKTAFALQYIKQFGGVMWQPEQSYPQNAVVSVNVINKGQLFIYILRSKVDNNTTQPFSNGTLTKEENGYCYFNNSTSIASNWESVRIHGRTSTSINVTPNSYTSTGDTNAENTFIHLVSMTGASYKRTKSVFTIDVYRKSKTFTFTVRITRSYNNSQTNLEILECDNVSTNYYTNQGKIAKMIGSYTEGCVLILDKNYNVLYLMLLGGDRSNGQVTISSTFVDGDIMPDIYKTTISTEVVNNTNYEIIYPLPGANNFGANGTGELVTSMFKLSPQVQAMNRLVMINPSTGDANSAMTINGTTVDTWLLPNFQRCFNGKSAILDINERYLVSNKGTAELMDASLPNIYGILGEINCYPEFRPPNSTQRRFQSIDPNVSAIIPSLTCPINALVDKNSCSGTATTILGCEKEFPSYGMYYTEYDGYLKRNILEESQNAFSYTTADLEYQYAKDQNGFSTKIMIQNFPTLQNTSYFFSNSGGKCAHQLFLQPTINASKSSPVYDATNKNKDKVQPKSAGIYYYMRLL